MALRVSELADLAGVPSDTIRYYEKGGYCRCLRAPFWHREFDAELAERLRFIKGAQSFGLKRLYIARVTDSEADREELSAAFAQRGLDIELELVPESPSLIGTNRRYGG